MRRLFLLLVLFCAFGALCSCGRHQVSADLQHEGELLGTAVRDIWMKEPAPDNIFFINGQGSKVLPPQLSGLLLRPGTSFDYLYVRTWLGGDVKQPVRRLIAYFVIHDQSTGARLRGTVKDAWINTEPLSRYHWNTL